MIHYISLHYWKCDWSEGSKGCGEQFPEVGSDLYRDRSVLEYEARKAGWTISWGKHYCPTHSSMRSEADKAHDELIRSKP